MSSRLGVSWEQKDRHLGLTLTGGALAAIAVTMAVVGLPPVDLHSPLHKMGIMDPLCGGTRAARLTAQGRLTEAWAYNPLGILTVMVAMLLVARAAIGLVGRRWLSFTLALDRRAKLMLIGAVVVLIALLEVRQQLRADLLMAGTHTWV